MRFDNSWAEPNSFARYSFESHKVAGQRPGVKSIDLSGTARGHGICRLALGVAAECFAVGRVFHTCVMSTGDGLVSWTFVLSSKGCSTGARKEMTTSCSYVALEGRWGDCG